MFQGIRHPIQSRHRDYPYNGKQGDKQGGQPKYRSAPPGGRGQHRQSPVTKVSSQPLPGYEPFPNTHGASPPTPTDFDTLIAQKTFDELNRKSTCFGQQYDGRNHSNYATNTKKYTLMGKQPLSSEEQNQLIPLLESLKPTISWSWRSLTTVIHAFTTAGVFTPKQDTDQTVKNQQQALLRAYLNATQQKCQTLASHDLDTQGITNLLWAMATLVSSGVELTPELKVAVTTLLPHVRKYSDQFKNQEVANLLWAIAKLVDNKLPLTTELEEAVTDLLTRVTDKSKPADFKTQDVANLLWAMTKLVDNKLPLTPKFKEAVTDLLTRVTDKSKPANFKTQDVANLLWATAKLGELIDTKDVATMPIALMSHIKKTKELTRQGLLTALWGLLSCSARLYLDGETDKSDELQASIAQLFDLTHNVPISNDDDKTIMMLAASWLGVLCPINFSYKTRTSRRQNDFFEQLVATIPSLQVEPEKQIGYLPPIDLFLPEHKIAIEIQGPYHYIDSNFQIRNGSTLLKIALLRKQGYEVIEVPVNQIETVKSTQVRIDQIMQTITGMSTSYATHSPMGLEEENSDKEYFTATSDSEPDSDSAYLSAPEDLSPVKKPVYTTAQMAQYLEETGHKTKKKKRKNKKKS